LYITTHFSHILHVKLLNARSNFSIWLFLNLKFCLYISYVTNPMQRIYVCWTQCFVLFSTMAQLSNSILQLVHIFMGFHNNKIFTCICLPSDHQVFYIHIYLHKNHLKKNRTYLFVRDLPNPKSYGAFTIDVKSMLNKNLGGTKC